ncbi:MAG: antitoxin VapB family protein [Candidatus Hydrothermarchaeales archaeon]
MTTKTVRISDKVYKHLFEIAGQLQTSLKRPVSVDETIAILIRRFKMNQVSDLAGSWEVSDEEVEKIKKTLAEGWRKWSL